MSKTTLITGAAGFIGFHLALHLKQKGEQVIGLDNFNDYYDPSLKRSRAQILDSHDIPLYEADIRDPAALDRIMAEHQPSHIAHLAAQAGVRYSLENPMSYIASNIEGFTQILELCRRNPGVILCYASSSSVYGLNQKIPFSETDSTDSPASLYGATKKSNEVIAHSYHHLYGIPCTGLRFFTVYGPWGRPDMAYYSFSDKLLSGEEIPVFNHGDMGRDFTYVDDIVAGIDASLNLGAPWEIFNLGNSHPERLGSMIQYLEALYAVKAQIRYMPMQPGDVKETYADISHSINRLNYKPITSLEEGLSRFADWFQSYRRDPQSTVGEWVCPKSLI